MRLPYPVPPEFETLRQEYAVVNGHRIAYVEAGEGPPILVLHGAISAGNVFWWETLVELAPHARVIAPDFPGWGASDKPTGVYTFDFYERFVSSFMDQMGLVRPLVVGHSMGGLIGSAFAVTHPDRVAGLVTVAAPPAWVESEIPDLFHPLLKPLLGESMLLMAPMLGPDHPWGVRRFYEPLFHEIARINPARLRQALSGCCEASSDSRHLSAFLSTLRDNRRFFGAEGSREFQERLAGLQVPTLHIAGLEDPLFPHDLIRSGAERHPLARLEVLERCSHFPMWERPDCVGELIRALAHELALPTA